MVEGNTISIKLRKFLILKILFVITLIMSQVQNATVSMNSSSPNMTVGASTNITISVDRSVSSQGSTITPTPINTSLYSVVITFDNNYKLSTSSSTITYSFNSSQQNSTRFSIVVSPITNPLIASTPITTYVKIFDNNRVLIDQAQNSLSYTTAAIRSTDVAWSFNPQNVSTISNLSMIIKSNYFNASMGMYMEVNFRRYWNRSLVNSPETSIFSASSSCNPFCTITRSSSSTSILLTNSSLSQTFNSSISSINITFITIISPPSLQQIDQVQITIKQPQFSSAVEQITNLLVGAQAPNSFNSIAPFTANSIYETISLSIDVLSRNDFGRDDTITLILTNGSQLLSTDTSSIKLTSPLIVSYVINVQNLNTIIFSSFTLGSGIGLLYATITIDKIAQATSTKPRSNNKIELRRNSYMYNYDTFAYSVLQSTITSINVTIDNNFANSNTTGLWRIVFSKPVLQRDQIYVNVPQSITMISCQPFCAGCSCSLSMPTGNTPYTQLLINLDALSTSQLSELNISTLHRNPIIQNVNVTICSTDSENFTKQCDQLSYPDIVESSLSSQTLSLSFSNSYVYGTSTYTFYYNFTTYDLQNGYMITIIPPTIRVIDSNNIICKVNGQPLCQVIINSTGTYINTTVSSLTKLYTIVMGNLRNPASTEPFTISAKVAQVSGQYYYSIKSDYYNLTFPYTLLNGTHFTFGASSCKNSDMSNLTIVFNNINLPFVLSTQFGSQTYFQYNITTNKDQIGSTLLYNVNTTLLANLVYSYKNWYSYQPITYNFVLYTPNLLYQIWKFSLTLQNCQAQSIPIIGYQFTGLPQDSGTLKIVYTHQYSSYILSNSTQYRVQLTFPNEYSSQMVAAVNPSFYTITKTSNRSFSIQVLTNQQPIILQITNYTNPIIVSNNYTNNPIKIELFQNSYLIALDESTIFYKLSTITSCVYPCKLCDAGDGMATGTCLKCYSPAITNSYLLLYTVQGTTSTGRCVSSCPPTTYLNITLMMCANCPTSCLTCTNDSFCYNCSSNYYLYNNKCITDCPSSHYPSTANQTCVTCSPPCSSCTNQSYCKSCISGYYLYSGTCVTSCPTGYIVQNSSNISICFICTSPCLQCSLTLTNCTKCITGFYLTANFTCVSTCTDPQIGYSGVCTTCQSTCYRCIQVPNKCISCTNQYKLYNNTCISDCPIGFYVSVVNSSSVCAVCPEQCTVCTSNTNCTQCASNLIFYLNYCYANCPVSMYISNTTIINSTANTTTIFRQCKPCASSSCLICPSDPTVCVSCAGGYNFYNSTCVIQCPTATYDDGNICRACKTNCLSCIDSIQCTSCVSLYSLYESTCVNVCPSSMISLNSTCKKCVDYILNCQNCSLLGCNTCLTGYYLFINNTNNTNGTCTNRCPTGYVQSAVNNISRCVQCQYGCSACSGISSNCTACVTGYFYDSGTCVLNCPYGKVILNGQCQSCISPCLTCSNNNTSYCQSCVNNMSLLIINATNRQCVSTCPTNYFNDNSSKRCVLCPTGCTSCQAEGCFACDTGYFLVLKSSQNNVTLYDCLTKCPSYLPFILDNNLCSQCSNNCIQCSASDNYACLQCKQPYLRYGKYCVLTCPVPYIVKSKSCVLPDNSTNDTTNNTNTTNTTTQTVTSTRAPVPFTIVLASTSLLAIVSKFQFVWTSISMSILAFSSFLTPICDIVYLIITWPMYAGSTTQTTVQSASPLLGQSTAGSVQVPQYYTFIKISLYLLIVAIAVIYVSNILHVIFSCATYRKDSLFQKYTQKHRIANKIILVMSLIFQHLIFVLYFCRLFNLSFLKSWLRNTHSLTCINYLWGLALVGNILGLAAGVIILVKDSTLIYTGIDLVVVNSITIITGLMLFKKSKGSGWIQQDYLQKPGYEASQDQFSTKKVVMLNHEGDSEAQIGNIYADSLQETFNKNKIKNQSNSDLENKSNQVVQKSNKEEDKQNQFFFQQDEGDNQSPMGKNKKSENKQDEQIDTDMNKNRDSNEQGSQSTDPMKIQPSINILLTAEEMKPGKNIQSYSIMNEKGLDKNQQNKSLGWSSISKQNNNKVLPNENRINNSSLIKNIFDDQEKQYQNEQHKQQSKRSNLQQGSYFFTTQNMQQKKVLNSQSSSKSLKTTPRSNKNMIEDNESSVQNLAAKGLSKSRRQGGRSSQQFVSSQKGIQASQGIKSNMSQVLTKKQRHKPQKKTRQQKQAANKKAQESTKRTNSRNSQIIKNSQLMGVIEEQAEQQNQPKNQHKQDIVDEPETLILRGEDRFLSNTLNEDAKLQSVSEFQDQLKSEKSNKTFKFTSRLNMLKEEQSAQLEHRSDSKNKIRNSNHNMKSPRVSSQELNKRSNILQINDTKAAQIQQIQEIKHLQNKDKTQTQKQELKLNDVNQYLEQTNPKKHIKIQAPNTIFIESDEQKNKQQQASNNLNNEEMAHNVTRNYNTIANNRQVPASAGQLPRASKLRTLKLKQQLYKQKQKRTQKHQSQAKHKIKSFKSRNVSLDKMRPSTSDYQFNYGQPQDGEEGKKNLKQLMRQIQRKEKIRNHQESLKKIYLGK